MTAVAASAAPIPPCSELRPGWCLARRFAGDTPEGEFGFRFGEPLDLDGDGRADVAAGARFKRDGVYQNGRVSAWSGADGHRLLRWDGTLQNGMFGHWVLALPDLDGDGFAELVIAAPTATRDGELRGALIARSPKTDRVFWQRSGERNQNLGWDLAPAGDFDADGRTDVFAGAPSQDGGKAYLLSGADGTTLRTYASPAPIDSFGWFVARTDDLDGDGHHDLVVGAPNEKTDAGVVGGAYGFSSATGAVLRHWNGSDALSGFGEVVAALADLDGDGRGEIAVGAPRSNDQTHTRPGTVFVYSSATGTPLHEFTGRQPGELFGRMVTSAGDVDGDGVADIAISAPWYKHDGAARTGRLEIRSGRSGTVLHELIGDAPDAWFGWHVRRAPDPDGKARPTLLISSLRRVVDGTPGAGVVDLYVLNPQP